MLNHKLLNLIIICLVLYCIIARPNLGPFDYYKIEVGAKAVNFSAKYKSLFSTIDKNHDGELSNSEILDFYNHAGVFEDDFPEIFKYENGKWLVKKDLRKAALEYYTKGRIETPELHKKYGHRFMGINSGINNPK